MVARAQRRADSARMVFSVEEIEDIKAEVCAYINWSLPVLLSYPSVRTVRSALPMM